MLKNARQQYAEEGQEIAVYLTIEAFAEKVGDKEDLLDRAVAQIYLGTAFWIERDEQVFQGQLRYARRFSRYLGFAHGALVRKPASGEKWEGQGKPVYAVTSGTIWRMSYLGGGSNTLGGNSVHLKAGDGTGTVSSSPGGISEMSFGKRRTRTRRTAPWVKFARQVPQLGTGHAARMCEPYLRQQAGEVFILTGRSTVVTVAPRACTASALASPNFRCAYAASPGLRPG